MGRKTLEKEVRRQTINITLQDDVSLELNNLNLKNNSQLVNWLLKEHFNMLKPILK
jgi:hypothetical protein